MRYLLSFIHRAAHDVDEVIPMEGFSQDVFLCKTEFVLYIIDGLGCRCGCKGQNGYVR